MAFGQGRVSVEGGNSFKRFYGVADVKVIAVNPTLQEMNEITGGNSEKEPEYVSEQDGVKSARVVIWVKSTKDINADTPAPLIPLTFWLRKQPVVGSKSGKVQVIDKYGRTAWATEEEIKNKEIPQYSNGPANIDKDYRKICNGEEDLTEFIKTFLNIPPITYYDKKKQATVVNPNPADCECRLDNIFKVFDNDFKEIKQVFSLMPNNFCKVLFGVRTVEERSYQDFFRHKFLTSRDTNLIKFATAVKEQKDLGRYSTTYFGEEGIGGLIIDSLKVQEVVPTPIADANKPVPMAAPFTTDKAPDSTSDMPF